MAAPRANFIPSIMSATITPAGISTDIPMASICDQMSSAGMPRYRQVTSPTSGCNSGGITLRRKSGPTRNVAVADHEDNRCPTRRSFWPGRKPSRSARRARPRSRLRVTHFGYLARSLSTTASASSVAAARAKDDLEVRIVLAEEALQRLFQLGLHAVHRLQDGDRRADLPAKLPVASRSLAERSGHSGTPRSPPSRKICWR